MASRPSRERAYRRSPVQGRSEERVERILIATAKLTARMPPESITTTQIAAAAEMSVGSIYRYFTDADAVMQALLQRSISELVARLRSGGLSLAGPDWRHDLRNALDIQVDYLQDLDTGFHALWFASSGALAASIAQTTRAVDDALVVELIAELSPERRERLGETPEVVVRLAIGILTKGTELAFSATRTKADPDAIEETKKAVIGYLARYLD
jgi:AcrR family transcriptional regulator